MLEKSFSSMRFGIVKIGGVVLEFALARVLASGQVHRKEGPHRRSSPCPNTSNSYDLIKNHIVVKYTGI